jgi:hypothetical protein
MMQSIGREAAIAMADTGWWKTKTPREICQFQLFTRELAMDFGAFHEALEKALGRPVFTHELGMNHEGLCREFLGEAPAPSLADIINLIPEEKRILVVVGGSNG